MAKKVKLHLAEVPDDDAGKLKTCLDLYRKITGKEPTAEDIAAAKLTLSLPPNKPESL